MDEIEEIKFLLAKLTNLGINVAIDYTDNERYNSWGNSFCTTRVYKDYSRTLVIGHMQVPGYIKYVMEKAISDAEGYIKQNTVVDKSAIIHELIKKQIIS